MWKKSHYKYNKCHLLQRPENLEKPKENEIVSQNLFTHSRHHEYCGMSVLPDSCVPMWVEAYVWIHTLLHSGWAKKEVCSRTYGKSYNS